MENNKLLLIYGFSDEEIPFFHNVVDELSIPSIKVIEKSMANMKLQDIIKGLKLDTYDKQLPHEKVVLFNNFADSELDAAIKKIRTNTSLKPILAVITPTSVNWEFHYLMEHLIEEREQARKFMQSK